MSLRYLAGFITASYNPLKVPNAPTIGTVTAGNAQVSVAFTAPSNVGGSAITSYTAVSSGGQTASGTSSPIVVTGLTNGVSYTFQVFATNSYGPSAFSATSGAATPVNALLYSWGANSIGQLGQYNTVYRSSPTQIGSIATWSAINGAVNDAGDGSSFYQAFDISGTLWSWGYNNTGQLGHNNIAPKSSPVQVGALTTWTTGSVGSLNMFAIKSDGTLWSCGYNFNGELGINSKVAKSSPTQIGGLTNWSKVSAGGDSGNGYTIAIKTDGTLWSWGNNSAGQLGQNISYLVNRSSPVQVGSDTNWLSISSGLKSVSAIRTDGTLWAWGANGFGQLGINLAGGGSTYRSSPVQVGALTTWSQVASNYYYTMAIKTDGTLWAWGWNQFGELGQNNTTNYSSPVQVGALATWLQGIGGYHSSYAVKTDGTLWAWGRNNNGQLAQNDTVNRSSPTQIGSSTNWNRVTSSVQNAIALTK